MRGSLGITTDLSKQFEAILTNLYHQAKAESVLLADISGQLIDVVGQMNEGHPATLAALAASDVAAMSELSRQIGETQPQGAFLHEGNERGIYLSKVSDSFVLIVIFRSEIPLGLVRLFAKQGVQQLEGLAEDFESSVNQPVKEPAFQSEDVGEVDFGSALAEELEKAFGGF